MCLCTKLNGSNDGSTVGTSVDLSASAGSVACRGSYLRVVGFLVHQRVDLGRIGNLEFEKPAIAQRIGVDERRICDDRLVGLDDFAA